MKRSGYVIDGHRANLRKLANDAQQSSNFNRFSDEISINIYKAFEQLYNNFQKNDMIEANKSLITISGLLKNNTNISILPGFDTFHCDSILQKIFTNQEYKESRTLALNLLANLTAQNFNAECSFYSREFVQFLFSLLSSPDKEGTLNIKYILYALDNIYPKLSQSDQDFVSNFIKDHNEIIKNCLEFSDFDIVERMLMLLNEISKKMLILCILPILPSYFMEINISDYDQYVNSPTFEIQNKIENVALSIIFQLSKFDHINLDLIQQFKLDVFVNKVLNSTQAIASHGNMTLSSTYACGIIYYFLEKYHSLYPYNIETLIQITINVQDPNTRYVAAMASFAIGRRNNFEVFKVFQQNPDLFNQIMICYLRSTTQTKVYIGRMLFDIIPLLPIDVVLRTYNDINGSINSLMKMTYDMISLENELTEFGFKGIINIFNSAQKEGKFLDAINFFLSVYPDQSFFQEIEIQTPEEEALLKILNESIFNQIRQISVI